MQLDSNLLRSRAGFTLAEMTIALGIFSLVLIAMTVVITQFYRIYDAGHQIRTTQEAARSVAEDITDDTHNALSIVVNPTGNDGFANICIYTTYTEQTNTLNGIEYFVDQDPLNTAAQAVKEVPVTYNGAVPATSCPNPRHIGSNAQIITSDTVTVKGFTATATTAPPNAAPQILAVNPQVLSVSLSIASTAGQDLLQADPNNPGLYRCPGGAGSEYCSLTNLQMSALDQVGSSS